ncbi:MAG: glycerophosphodiester phosphodiesterase [Usitatibacter sp.]
MDLGCDFVEIDVRTTKDGKFVSIHDSKIDDYVPGKKGRVNELTYDELRALDIGIKKGTQWEGTRIPSFEEILQLCHGKIGIYLDLKSAPVDKLVETKSGRRFGRQPPDVAIEIWRARQDSNPRPPGS